MDPNEIVTLTIIGSAFFGWFKTFDYIGGAPHFHHHRRHHRH